MQTPTNIRGWQKLFRNPAWTLIAAFGTYFCMYGFRKPYTAASYSNSSYLGIDYKILLIIAQTAGYVMAKWLGIKFVSEIKRGQRIKMLLALIIGGELTLLLFGIVPRPWNIICLLLNGLSLGIIFGLVLGFLEGRRNSEALIAGLCASFIVSDGVSKSVGTMLLDKAVTEEWMPFFAGLIFLVPALVFISMLGFVRPPSALDEASRSPREPMNASTRWRFFKKYAPGLMGITLVYLFTTLLRSVRADFAPELWKGLDYRQNPAVFTQSELLVSLGVTLISGFSIFLLNHFKAFRFSLLNCFAGFAIIVIAVAGLQMGLGKFSFMVLLGLGVYIPYVAIHTTLFERLIAVTRERANIGFLMYLVDSVGYTAYVILMLFKYLTPAGDSILFLFLRLCIYLGIAGAVIVILCNWYFRKKIEHNEQPITQLSSRQSSYI